jgi:hypothetical protein
VKGIVSADFRFNGKEVSTENNIGEGVSVEIVNGNTIDRSNLRFFGKRL